MSQLKDLHSKIKDIKVVSSSKAYFAEGDIGDNNSEFGEPSESKASLTVEAMLSELQFNVVDNQSWILDCGASAHISHNTSSLVNLTSGASTSFVLTTNGSKMPISRSSCILLFGNKTCIHIVL